MGNQKMQLKKAEDISGQIVKIKLAMEILGRPIKITILFILKVKNNIQLINIIIFLK